jgi:hypothetical protein
MGFEQEDIGTRVKPGSQRIDGGMAAGLDRSSRKTRRALKAVQGRECGSSEGS